MQDIEPLPVRFVPIKLTLVVLRTKRSKEPLGLLAAIHDGSRLRPRLSRRALSENALLLLLLLSRGRLGGLGATTSASASGGGRG